MNDSKCRAKLLNNTTVSVDVAAKLCDVSAEEIIRQVRDGEIDFNASKNARGLRLVTASLKIVTKE